MSGRTSRISARISTWSVWVLGVGAESASPSRSASLSSMPASLPDTSGEGKFDDSSSSSAGVVVVVVAVVVVNARLSGGSVSRP